MSALSGLRALRHLDLDLGGAVEIGGGNAESSGSHLLHGTVPNGSEALLILAAFSGVRLSADGVHGAGQRLMRFRGKRAVGHRPCLEAFYDRLLALRLLHRDRGAGRDDLKQGPEGVRTLLIIHQSCVLLKELIISRAHRPLQGHDRLGTVQMIFFVGTASKRMEADGVQLCVHCKAKGIKSLVMAKLHVFPDLFHPDPADSADRTGKAAVDHIAAKADCLKDARGLIGLQRRDAHFRRDLHNA